jgi:hypothetical protein
MFSDDGKLNYRPRKKKKDPEELERNTLMSFFRRKSAVAKVDDFDGRPEKKVNRIEKEMRYMDEEFLDYSYLLPNLPKMTFQRLGLKKEPTIKEHGSRGLLALKEAPEKEPILNIKDPANESSIAEPLKNESDLLTVPGITTSNLVQNLLHNTISNASQNFLNTTIKSGACSKIEMSAGSCGIAKSPNYACSSNDILMAAPDLSNQCFTESTENIKKVVTVKRISVLPSKIEVITPVTSFIR